MLPDRKKTAKTTKSFVSFPVFCFLLIQLPVDIYYTYRISKKY